MLSGRSDIPLDPRGAAEAAALADALAGCRLTAIYSSPRRRTLETAAAIAQRHGMPVQIAPALDEIDFGRFAGRSFAALEDDPAWHRWNGERGSARCPDGETMREAVDRVIGFLAAVPDAAAPVLCVTHCDIIRGVVAQVLGLPFERMFALGCEPGSLTTLCFDGGDIRVETLNQRSWPGTLQD